MWKDPIVEEIRKLRDEYAAKFNYDLAAIFRDLQQKQKNSGREFVSLAPRPVTTKAQKNVKRARSKVK